jgi:hypothetical protein
MIGKGIKDVLAHKVPWFMRRNRCALCAGYHAPWWRFGEAPSCTPGSSRVNDMTMFLETLKATGQ